MTTKAQKDYTKGKIYMIKPKYEHVNGDVYIGSTTKKYLSQRMTSHKYNYKYWNDDKIKNRCITSYILFDKYGVNNCDIVLLENVEANNYDELISREKHFIKLLSCVNKRIEGRPKEEYYKDTKEHKTQYGKQYREENADKIKERQKSYRMNNKDKIKNNNALYRIDNKDKVSLTSHLSYIKNKDKILNRQNETYYCGCGSSCRKNGMQEHFRSKKHLKYLEDNNKIEELV